LKKLFSNICKWCKRLSYIVKKLQPSSRVHFSPNKKKILDRFRKTKKIVTQKFSRANSKISTLKQNLSNVKRKLEEITDINLNSILKNTNIPQCQTELVFEILKASKVKNLKNRRYSDNWMLLCLLFQIRYLI